MPALGAGIHDFSWSRKVVDGRANPGHDGQGGASALAALAFRSATLIAAFIAIFIFHLSSTLSI